MPSRAPAQQHLTKSIRPFSPLRTKPLLSLTSFPSDYDDYLSGLDTADVLLLAEAHRLDAPLSLDQMRQTTAFQPPHSYRYMSQASLRTLVNGHPSGASLLALLPDS